MASRTQRATLAVAEDQAAGNEAAALAFSPDGRMLAVAVARSVQLWEVATGRLVAKLRGHERKVTCLAFAPEGRWLASGSYDTTVRLWDVATCRPTPP
jgi:WD40 repeat protein